MTYIAIKDLSLTYQTKTKSVHALSHIDLDIEEGEFVSLIGPSGCGKSTLLSTIGALLEPTSGSVTIAGQTVQEVRKQRKIGNVFQEARLLPWRTVGANIAYLSELAGQRPRQSEIQEIADFVGIGAFLNSYPHELSGGMRQRVSLCRAMILDPMVLLMDEPFGALDAITREKMQVELLRIWEETKKTIVFVTHAIDEAAYLSDRIVVMSARPGRIQADYVNPLVRPREPFGRQTHETSDFQSVLHGELMRAETEERTDA
ncbi:ABC transporter ATP-binding protein [Leucobacter muris]|uniref:ABC transporter ATP-binding protein n=1 Tax=Leucobacter muris TaxID=1935379 RepID=A0ABX5QE57_9MICO|nr:ABC transporter ATP-binding protein [Leucobacter muris]QAB17251.1 ABC transporter ATP-binding protein [Leucobacter muris]